MNEMQVIWLNAGFFWVLLPLLIFAAVLLIRCYAWQKRTAHLLGESHLKHFSVVRKFLKMICKIGAFCALALALGRPQWGSREQSVAQEGRDVLIALDISRSMLAQDNKPSRLAVAKKKITHLLESLTTERVSLMVFSGVALVTCPFTTDSDAFMNFLDLADVEVTSSGTTALDKALKEAINTFETVPGRKQRLMVLFTDGEDFSSDLGAVGKKAHDLGLRIFIVGMGTPEGAPIPLFDENGVQQGHQKDEKEAIVITRLNEALLRNLAQETGGTYIRTTQNDDDISQIVRSVKRFEKEKFDDKTFTTKNDQFRYFAAISFLLLLGEWFL